MKKIMLLAPMFLLTPILFGCNQQKDDVDPCIIASEEKFNEAISFKNVEYAQMTRQYVIAATSIVNVIYQEAYFSPTVYNEFSRTIYGDKPTDPSEKYVEKTKEEGEDKYYLYEKDSITKEWGKKDAEPGDFVTPTAIGNQVKRFLDSGGVTYDIIKDKYDKYRQAYYFETAEDDYAVIMSFYNNQLNYFSYVYENDTTVKSSVTGITYGPITPELPEVDSEL